ncbi:MAG: DUF5060 domain-containing protein [Planctomycetota bacterium]
MRKTNRFQAGNAAISILSVVLFVGVVALLLHDVYRTWNRASTEHPSVRLARENLQRVNDPANGWFPFQREPVYDWEDGMQGWMLEDENPVVQTSATERDPDQEAPPAIETHGTPSTAPTSKLSTVSANGRKGKALAVPARFPDPVTVFRSNSRQGDQYRMIGVRFIAYDVYVPGDCPGFVGCLFFMKDKDGLWYQARSRSALIPGAWTTVTADIRGGSPDVTPLGHQGQWDDNQASQIRTLGLTFYGDKPFTGKILIDNFRGWVRASKYLQTASTVPVRTSSSDPKKPSAESLQDRAQKYKDPPLRVLNLRTEPPGAPSVDGKPAALPVVKKFETLTLRFELNRQVDNPFDPAIADITCEVVTPAHTKLEHIGFWYQDYDRTDRFEGDDLAPIGRPEWRVRITPREEGEYSYTLKIRVKDDTITLPARKFVSVASSEKGFVRVSKQNPQFFEFENGEFYYPVGHNLHSPVDMRCWQQILKSEAPAGRGLPMYADFFPKMKNAGENTAEIWMASWWLGIEWTARWRDYYGRGRYSLQHAWKLDTLLEMARENGIHIHLVLDNHGKFSTYCDWEWDLNPYNMRKESANGGICRYAGDFFSDETAKASHKNKLRYIAARWGADPTVMGFELVSEFDLVGEDPANRRSQRIRPTFHKTPIARGWVHEMIEALKKYDPYDHLVSNHYATDYQWVDVELAKSKMESGAPLFDYIVTDAYRQTVSGGYVTPANKMQLWYQQSIAPYAQKPFWITEYGGDFNGAVETSLDSDVVCGLWATWMTEGAGSPLMWWFDFVDQRNLYSYYAGFSKYIAGEDRRDLKGATGGTHESGVGFQFYKWQTGAYAWAYDAEAMRSMPPVGSRQNHASVKQTLTGLQAGAYRVEYWDCYKGVVVKADDVTITKGESIHLTFPPFQLNMAVKVKLAK